METIRKHTKLCESTLYTVLPEISKGSQWQFAAQPSWATVHTACKVVFPKASPMQERRLWHIRSQPFPTSEYIRALLEYPTRSYIEISRSCIFAVWFELASLSAIISILGHTVKLFLWIFVLFFPDLVNMPQVL